MILFWVPLNQLLAWNLPSTGDKTGCNHKNQPTKWFLIQGQGATIPLLSQKNGEPTDVNEFLEFTSVRRISGDHLCGGVLIDADSLLTVASCLFDSSGRPFNIDEVKPKNLDIVSVSFLTFLNSFCVVVVQQLVSRYNIRHSSGHKQNKKNCDATHYYICLRYKFLNAKVILIPILVPYAQLWTRSAWRTRCHDFIDFQNFPLHHSLHAETSLSTYSFASNVLVMFCSVHFCSRFPVYVMMAMMMMMMIVCITLKLHRAHCVYITFPATVRHQLFYPSFWFVSHSIANMWC